MRAWTFSGASEAGETSPQLQLWPLSRMTTRSAMSGWAATASTSTETAWPSASSPLGNVPKCIGIMVVAPRSLVACRASTGPMCCLRWYHSGMNPPMGRRAILMFGKRLPISSKWRPQPVSPAK